MRTKTVSIAAASVALILGTAGAFASQPKFRSPTTDLAQKSQPVLARAAKALNTKVPGAGTVSNLWIYPTAEKDVVFAQYIVTTNKASIAVPEQHFELLKLKNDRMVEQSDLTRVGNDISLRAKRAADPRDWPASIGTGHVTSAPVTSASPAGSPASPHWSASIGTGSITGESNRRLFATTSASSSSHVPNAHWTSKIGSARAAEPTTKTSNGKVTS